MTLFSDETAFYLFRNTIKWWYSSPKPIRPLPKSRQKVFAWGGFCVKGKASLFCFTEIINAEIYVGILCQHYSEIRRILGRQWRFQQDKIQNILVVLPKIFLMRPPWSFGLAIQQPRPQPHRKPMEYCQTQCRKTYTIKY